MSDLRTRSMLSGPVSSMSSGPVSAGKGMAGGPSVTEASAGAVKHDVDAPLGQRISAPLRELAPLQEQLKRLRAEGNAAAVSAAAAPVSAPVEAPEAAPLDDTGAAPDDGDEYADAPYETDDADADLAIDPPAEAPHEDVPDRTEPTPITAP